MKKTLVILTRWGLIIGLIILALVIVGEILRRRAWEDVADIPAPSPSPVPPPRMPEPPVAPAAAAEPTDGACPATHPVKGNIRTHDGEEDRIYHLPGSQYYERTRAEVCFRTEEDAIAAGFRAPRPG